MNFFLSSFSPVILWEWILLSGISWEIFDKFFRLTYSRHVSNIGGRKSRNITFSYIHTVHMTYRNWCTTFSSWLIQSNYWLIAQRRQCRKIFTPFQFFSLSLPYPTPDWHAEVFSNMASISRGYSNMKSKFNDSTVSVAPLTIIFKSLTEKYL